MARGSKRPLEAQSEATPAQLPKHVNVPTPRLTPSGNKDLHDEYACRHEDDSGKFCNSAPSDRLDARKRKSKAAEHTANVNAHKYFCGPSCRACQRHFGMSAKQAYIIAIARQWGFHATCVPSSGVTSASGPADPPTPVASATPSSSASTPARSTRSMSATPVLPGRTCEGCADIAVLNRNLEFLQQFARNCRDAVAQVGVGVRQPLVQALTRNLYPRIRCAELLGMSRRTLERLVKPSIFSLVLWDLSRVGISRKRKLDSATEVAKQFWYSLSRQSRQVDPDTGERVDRWYCGVRKIEAWARYVSFMMAGLVGDGAMVELPEEPNYRDSDLTVVDFPVDVYNKHKRKVLKRTSFIKAIPSNVYKEKLLEASCPICRDGMRAEDELLRMTAPTDPLDASEMSAAAEDGDFCPVAQEQLRSAVTAMNTHLPVVRHQRRKQQDHRDNVGKKGYPDVLINMDFSPFANVYDARRSTADGMGSDTQNLIVTIYYRRADGEVGMLNVDNFARESNDHVFVRRVLLNIMTLDVVRRRQDQGTAGDRIDWLEFWSDGGPKHFKTRRSLFFVCVELRKRYPWMKKLTWAFYASHHGKSVNDAHAAVVKRKLWRLASSGERTEGPEQLAAVAKSVRNTDAFFFDRFDREELYDVSTMGGIRSHHLFLWSEDPKVRRAPGYKYTISMYKLYPDDVSRVDDNCTQVAVSERFSIEYDDVAGDGLDRTGEQLQAEARKRAEEAKAARIQARKQDRLRLMRSTGTKIKVRYDMVDKDQPNKKPRPQWWNATVHDSRERNEEGEDSLDVPIIELCVTFDLDDLARKRGLTEEASLERCWVPLNSDVRLVAVD